MKAVVAGAGTLGRKISDYLINAGYEVIFIDYNLETIREVTDNEGLAGIYGQCTSLEIMRNADVGNAEIFIAVTSVDEINILACQVANYFGTPRKIAKINGQNYLTDDWLNNMYDPERLDITAIIAVNIILVDNIIKTLSLNNNYIDKCFDFFDGKIKVFSILCSQNFKIIKESINNFYKSFSEFSVKIIAINRDNIFINIDDIDETIIHKNDRIYVLIPSNQLVKFLDAICTKEEVEKYYDYNYITLIGVHDAIFYLAKKLMNIPKVRLNILTTDTHLAHNIAEELQQTAKDRLNIIVTDHFENSIKNIYSRYNEKFIIINRDDSENTLLSLYCKYANLSNIFCVLQDSEYESLLNYIGINNIYVTDQYILNPVINELKGPYEHKAVLLKNDFKLVEIYIAHKSIFIGKSLNEINNSYNGIKAIAALTGSKNFNEEIYIQDTSILLQEGDIVMFLIQYPFIKKAEELFNQLVV